MSKSTKSGDWPLLERLTNDEFLKILPHLSLEQYILTQVFVPKKKWIRLLDANLQTLQLKCAVCNKQVRFEDIKNHLALNDHLMSLHSNVKQFYHPFYTYGKIDIKLARGEEVPQEMRKSALREVYVQMKSLKKEYIFAKQFANSANRRSLGVEGEQLIDTSLGKKIDNPDDMIVVVSLPLEDISKLLFCIVNNEWQSVFSYKYLTKKATFHCKICSTNCCGIESLNSHLNGYTHRLRQLELLALSYKDSSRVNKNCCIQFGNSFSFAVKSNAKNLNRNKDVKDYESWITELPNEMPKMIIKALNEYGLKMFSCAENSLVESSGNEGLERFESSKICEDILGQLGVEYVLKIMENNTDQDPRYECGLCKFFGDGKNMQRHLVSFDHRKKYLDLHYFDTIKKYESLIGHMSYKEFRAVMSEIVYKVAIEIEKHHGRSLPFTVSLSDYENRRPELIEEVHALLHASQNRGPSFSKVVSKEGIQNLKNSAKKLAESKKNEYPECVVFTTAPKNQIYLKQMSHDPVVRLREYNAKLNKKKPWTTSRPVSPIHGHVFNSTRRGGYCSDQTHTLGEDQRTRSRSPIPSKTRSDGILSSNALTKNIWDIYRREMAFAANEIEAAYESYRKNPESHPLYEVEWNNFWQRRKKELESEGCSHRSYNFQPEWVHYFKQRIEFLFGEALHKLQIDVRQRLNIPLDAEEDCQRSTEFVNQNILDRRMADNAIAIKEIGGFKRHKRRSSHELQSTDLPNKRLFPEVIPELRREDINEKKSLFIVPKINDNHSNVIHVLRLITALEEHLGSLGERVMDLLSNALQLEKSYSGEIAKFEEKVLTIGNCNLLETAMEKLKGIIFAGLLDEKKISGFSRVITHTANLLKYAEKMGWRQDNNASEKNNFENIDRASIAVTGHTYGIQNSRFGAVSKVDTEKALSDTLMDIVNAPPTVKQPIQISVSEEQFGSHLKEHLNIPDCPPPPNIRETNINRNLFPGFQGQQRNSGLASFNTKLSLDQAHQSQKLRRDLHLQSDLGQLHRSKISGGNNIYNNSFKNNNETRTNARTINGHGIEDGMNYRNGTSPNFRIPQIIPNMGQSNVMNQEGGGGNRNQNWLQWK